MKTEVNLGVIGELRERDKKVNNVAGKI